MVDSNRTIKIYLIMCCFMGKMVDEAVFEIKQCAFDMDLLKLINNNGNNEIEIAYNSLTNNNYNNKSFEDKNFIENEIEKYMKLVKQKLDKK